MAKTHKLSTSWQVKAGVLDFSVTAREPDADKDAAPVGEFSRKVDLRETFGDGYSSLNDAGQSAVEFGAFTALRNSTGGADDLSEAESAVDRRLDAWAKGEWGSERESSATPFSPNHSLSKAVERASQGSMDAATAAEKLCAMAEKTCEQNGLGSFSAAEPADRAKVRKAIIDQIRKEKPAIGAAFDLIESEKREEAEKRKREKAQELLNSGEAVTL